MSKTEQKIKDFLCDVIQSSVVIPKKIMITEHTSNPRETKLVARFFTQSTSGSMEIEVAGTTVEKKIIEMLRTNIEEHHG